MQKSKKYENILFKFVPVLKNILPPEGAPDDIVFIDLEVNKLSFNF